MPTYTAPQQDAITSDHPSMLVLAGPGSGKTATTVGRICHLIEKGVPPAHIVALTFTNAAARELERRVNATGPQIILGYVGTLHGFALRMLKKHGADMGYGQRMSIISPESAEMLLLAKAKGLGSKTKLKDLLKLKAEGRPTFTGRTSIDQAVVLGYYDDLADAGIVDFDLLLTEFLRLLRRDPLPEAFEYLFVDEVQDSALIDWTIYEALPIANKFYVGDPDQAIYGFRGGDVALTLDKHRDNHTQTIRLEQNFRSDMEICEAAQRLIDHNSERAQKTTFSTRPGGEVIIAEPAENEGEEAAKIKRMVTEWCNDTAASEIAVLARTNAIAYAIRQQLEAAGLPVAKPAKLALPVEWKELRAWVELMVNPNNDTLAFFLLQHTHPVTAQKIKREAALKGISINNHMWQLVSETYAIHALHEIRRRELVTTESGMLLAQIQQQLSPDATTEDLALHMAQIRDGLETPATVGIQCLTMHGAKGMEFDAVAIAGFEDQLLPGKDPLTIEDERRLAYVAITRARHKVYITHALQRTTPWGAIENRTPSRFLKEILA